jgi:hypothetical protein
MQEQRREGWIADVKKLTKQRDDASHFLAIDFGQDWKHNSVICLYRLPVSFLHGNIGCTSLVRLICGGSLGGVINVLAESASIKPECAACCGHREQNGKLFEEN